MCDRTLTCRPRISRLTRASFYCRRKSPGTLPRGNAPADIKLVVPAVMPLLSGFPFFSEAIQVAYSNPERRLSRKRPPRCPSSKPSSMWEGGLGRMTYM